MAVKGSLANMNIYNGKYLKKQQKSVFTTTPTGPPPEDGLLGAGPSSLLAPVTNIPSFPLSEEYHNGTISEREMLELARQFGLDRTGILSKDRALLQKTLQNFSEKLNLKINEIQSERRGKSGTSIQNVLTKDFEYSDDEDDKEKDTELEKPKSLTHDEIFEYDTSRFMQAIVIFFQIGTKTTLSTNHCCSANGGVCTSFKFFIFAQCCERRIYSSHNRHNANRTNTKHSSAPVNVDSESATVGFSQSPWSQCISVHQYSKRTKYLGESSKIGIKNYANLAPTASCPTTSSTKLTRCAAQLAADGKSIDQCVWCSNKHQSSPDRY